MSALSFIAKTGIGNDYNMMKCDNLPYKFDFGNVVMLFYSSDK